MTDQRDYEREKKKKSLLLFVVEYLLGSDS